MINELRVLDLDGNEIENPNLSLGSITKEEIIIAHHEAIEAVAEVSHYETIKTYPNGGKDVQKVIDVEAVEAKDAWDEKEEIYRYIPFTPGRIAKNKIKASRSEMSSNEVLELLIPNVINTITVDNNTAIRMKRYYPEWKVGMTLIPGNKVRYKDDLFVVNENQGHTAQLGWEPDVATSLFTRVDEDHEGTMDDPIVYKTGMILYNGKYYFVESTDKLYLCNRDSINPLYNELVDLVDLYVEEVE